VKGKIACKAASRALLLLVALSLAAYCRQQPATTIPGRSAPADAAVTTYAGHILPMDGVRADAESIGSPISIASDPAGGFYFSMSSCHMSAIYHVSADGILARVIGGKSGDDLPLGYSFVCRIAANLPCTIGRLQNHYRYPQIYNKMPLVSKVLGSWLTYYMLSDSLHFQSVSLQSSDNGGKLKRAKRHFQEAKSVDLPS
jgi:hypothetical protein